MLTIEQTEKLAENTNYGSSTDKSEEDANQDKMIEVNFISAVDRGLGDLMADF